jgi:response regulator NasT
LFSFRPPGILVGSKRKATAQALLERKGMKVMAPKDGVMETAALQTLRIVIADDDPTVRLFFRNALEKDARHQVVGEAADGAEMIRTVLDQKPDVIIFDIHMPALDGLEALRRIYEQQIVAAVAITADRDLDLVRRAMEEHVLAYLVKPVDEHQLGPALQVAWARFQELRSLSSENTSLRQTLENRKIVERAKGVLMKRQRLNEGDAYRRIQRAAMNRRQTMLAIAQGILSGEINQL